MTRVMPSNTAALGAQKNRRQRSADGSSATQGAAHARASSNVGLDPRVGRHLLVAT